MTSIREAYAKATHATHLRTTADKRGATDYLIASAWTPTRMGWLLRRVQSEWDGAAKKLRMTETDYALLMSSLKTLPAAIHAAEAWCVKKGIDKVGARPAVHWWLDNTCHHCHGRGARVVPGTPMLGDTCHHCGGTGKRREPTAAHQVLDMFASVMATGDKIMQNHLRY